MDGLRLIFSQKINNTSYRFQSLRMLFFHILIVLNSIQKNHFCFSMAYAIGMNETQHITQKSDYNKKSQLITT